MAFFAVKECSSRLSEGIVQDVFASGQKGILAARRPAKDVEQPEGLLIHMHSPQGCQIFLFRLRAKRTHGKFEGEILTPNILDVFFPLAKIGVFSSPKGC